MDPLLRSLPLLALVACAAPAPVETPFEGPGYDPETGLLADQDAPFLVALTELHVKNAPGPGKRFGELADAVGTHLYRDEPAGFVGGSFRNVGKLEWWPMTVWTDEVAMTDFILSEPHASAMTELSEVAVAARSTHTEFPAGGEPPTWDWALDTLDGVGWLVGP